MSLAVVQFGNYGFKVIVNVKDPAGAVRNLTGAANVKIKIKCITGLTDGKIFNAALENPAQGAVSYVVASGDIDRIGVWKVQAYYELSGWFGHTLPVEAFYVEGNLA